MVHAMEGSSQLARSSLRTASDLYPFCPKPHNGLGAMLLADSRPRAALREYERALALRCAANHCPSMTSTPFFLSAVVGVNTTHHDYNTQHHHATCHLPRRHTPASFTSQTTRQHELMN